MSAGEYEIPFLVVVTFLINSLTPEQRHMLQSYVHSTCSAAVNSSSYFELFFM
jgi:hypothetical protein